jgi:hypothetical protein
MASAAPEPAGTDHPHTLPFRAAPEHEATVEASTPLHRTESLFNSLRGTPETPSNFRTIFVQFLEEMAAPATLLWSGVHKLSRPEVAPSLDILDAMSVYLGHPINVWFASAARDAPDRSKPGIIECRAHPGPCPHGCCPDRRYVFGRQSSGFTKRGAVEADYYRESYNLVASREGEHLVFSRLIVPNRLVQTPDAVQHANAKIWKFLTNRRELKTLRLYRNSLLLQKTARATVYENLLSVVAAGVWKHEESMQLTPWKTYMHIRNWWQRNKQRINTWRAYLNLGELSDAQRHKCEWVLVSRFVMKHKMPLDKRCRFEMFKEIPLAQEGEVGEKEVQAAKRAPMERRYVVDDGDESSSEPDFYRLPGRQGGAKPRRIRRPRPDGQAPAPSGDGGALPSAGARGRPPPATSTGGSAPHPPTQTSGPSGRHPPPIADAATPNQAAPTLYMCPEVQAPNAGEPRLQNVLEDFRNLSTRYQDLRARLAHVRRDLEWSPPSQIAKSSSPSQPRWTRSSAGGMPTLMENSVYRGSNEEIDELLVAHTGLKFRLNPNPSEEKKYHRLLGKATEFVGGEERIKKKQGSGEYEQSLMCDTTLTVFLKVVQALCKPDSVLVLDPSWALINDESHSKELVRNQLGGSKRKAFKIMKNTPRLILAPLSLGNHFVLLAVQYDGKHTAYVGIFDSKYSQELMVDGKVKGACKTMQSVLQELYLKQNESGDPLVIRAMDFDVGPQQDQYDKDNVTDCGLFVCLNALSLVRGRLPDYALKSKYAISRMRLEINRLLLHLPAYAEKSTSIESLASVLGTNDKERESDVILILDWLRNQPFE